MKVKLAIILLLLFAVMTIAQEINVVVLSGKYQPIYNQSKQFFLYSDNDVWTCKAGSKSVERQVINLLRSYGKPRVTVTGRLSYSHRSDQVRIIITKMVIHEARTD